MASQPSSSILSLATLSTSESHEFEKPCKRIHEGQDVSQFLTTKAYGDIMTFLLQLNRSMFPSKVQPEGAKSQAQSWDLGQNEDPLSESVEGLCRLLKRLEAIIGEVPPDQGPRRFGNVSFRTWYQKVEDSAQEWLNENLATLHVKGLASGVSIYEELMPYFLGSFGSAQRLDYGSGHELSFLAFLGCIWKLGGFETPSPPPDNSLHTEQAQARAIVIHVLSSYLHLIRRLIQTYTLEPAGSHGVWGLDDHSFLPYIFGSAQYGPAISDTDQTPTEGSRADAPRPSDVAKASLVEKYRNRNLYFGAIGFIYDVKKGPFWEHSPMLYDISGVQAGWGKINKVSRKSHSFSLREVILHDFASRYH